MLTIRDVAKEAGVSVSTVSKALADRKDVSASTKKKIKNVAEKLGYSPNSIARALVTRSTRTIGLVTPYLGNPTIIDRVRGLQESAFRNHHILISCLNEGDVEEEREQIEALVSRRVDGIVLTPIKHDKELLGILEKARIPFVFMSEMMEGVDCDFTGDDDYEGGRLAARHLVALGHRRIAYFGVSGEASSGRQVLRGCREVLEEHGVAPDEALNAFGNQDRGVLEENLTRVLALKDPPTAVFAWSDIMAMHILQGLKERNIRVPEDVSLVGYDNVEFLSFFHVPLTTISQPNYEIGSTAADLLVERIEKGDQFLPRKVIFKPELIVRESTARAGTPAGKEL